MARIDVTKVEGFAELNKKLKRLGDNVKRKEVLAIQRRLAKPIEKAYRRNLPTDSGTLGKSVSIKTVSARRSGGNPAIVVRPGKKGKNNGFYKFMVIRKGDHPGSNRRGSRIGLNTVTENARNKTLSQTGNGVLRDSEGKVAKYIQRKIDRLSV